MSSKFFYYPMILLILEVMPQFSSIIKMLLLSIFRSMPMTSLLLVMIISFSQGFCKHWQLVFLLRTLVIFTILLVLKFFQLHPSFSLHKYIRDLLERTKIYGAKECPTPMSSSQTLQLHEDSISTYTTQFRQVISALQYLSLTRPDISYAINKLAQFMHSPSKTH